MIYTIRRKKMNDKVSINERAGRREIGYHVKYNVKHHIWGIKEVILFIKTMNELNGDKNFPTYKDVYEHLNWSYSQEIGLYPDEYDGKVDFDKQDYEKYKDISKDLTEAINDYPEFVERLVYDIVKNMDLNVYLDEIEARALGKKNFETGDILFDDDEFKKIYKT
jgi:hypothetical protein